MSPEIASAASAGEAMIADLVRFKPQGMTLNGWAVGAGVNRAVWGDIRRHSNPSRRTLERLLGFAGSSLAEFEALRIGSDQVSASAPGDLVRDRRAGWADGAAPAIPVVEARLGAPWPSPGSQFASIVMKAEFVGRIERPSSLLHEAGLFAFAMPSATMWPRFRQGRTFIVAPSMPVSPGDDVLVRIVDQARTEMVAVVGEIVELTAASITLRQFNPAATISVERSDIAAVQRIAGEAI